MLLTGTLCDYELHTTQLVLTLRSRWRSFLHDHPAPNAHLMLSCLFVQHAHCPLPGLNAHPHCLGNARKALGG